MRLPPQQLGQHLEKGLRALYVLTGDEPLAQRESLDAIRLAARNQGYDERTTLTVERSFNWQQLDAESRSMSLFASKRLLELHIPSGKPGIDGSKALQALAGKPPEDTVVVITLPKLDWQSEKSTWFVALEQAAVVMSFQQVTPDQLPQWIAQRLSQQGQQTDTETLEFIAHQVEGNLLAAYQEIQKLGLLYPQGVLAAEAVREAVLNVSRYDVFQLGDAMLAADSERTVRILRGLREEGTQVVALMGALVWLLRGIVRIKLAESRGENLANAIQQAKIRRDRQLLVERALRRLSLRQLQAAMGKLAEIDKIAKGIAHGDAWLEISRLCFGLATIGNRAKSH